MKFLILGFLSLISFSVFAQTNPVQINPKLLADLPAKLNYECGTNWCNGGDYGFDFKKAEFVPGSERFTLSLVMAPYDENGEMISSQAKNLKCIMYNFNNDRQLEDEDGGLTEALQLEITNCLDTLEANW